MPTIDLISLNESHYVFLSKLIPLPSIPGVNLDIFDINMKVAKNAGGLNHRFCLVFNMSEYIEIHTFGIKDEIDNPADFFINHINLLEFFCKYFRFESLELIRKTEKNRVLILPGKEIDKKLANENKYGQFYKEIFSKKRKFVGKAGKCFLTPRELECLILTASNKTAKEIGRFLCLSPRTVEDYLVNVKNKLGCQSKLELIQVAHENPIMKTFEDLMVI